MVLFTIWGEVGAAGTAGAVHLGGKLRRLLAGLLLHRGGEASRNDLIEIVWGFDSEPTSPEATLRLYIARLRRALDAVEDASGRMIVTTPAGYRLDTDDGTVDADVLHAAITGRPVDVGAILGLIQKSPFGSYGDEPWCMRASRQQRSLADQALACLAGRSRPVGGGRVFDVADSVGRLIGRDAEIEELLGLLDSKRVVNVEGAGGIGKTRLVLEAWARVHAEASHPVLFCDLSVVRAGSAVTRAVASAAGISEEPGATVTASLVSWIADGDILLILDNCEHLRRAVADLIEVLLGSCPNARIMTTSRGPIGHPAEQRFALGPLRTTDDGAELFVDRAQRVDPGFSSQVHTSAITSICARLDNIPLAIELAAARTRLLSPGEILERLDQEPGLLADRHGQRPARHRTITACIDSSIAHLSPDEMMFFSRLSVFAGGFTVSSSHAVCAEATSASQTSTLDHIEQLSGQSLVSVVERNEVSTRYRMLEPIRTHASSLLSEQQRFGVAEKHAAWFASRAHVLQQQLLSPEERAAGRLVEQELANFRSAHQWAVEEDPTTSAKLVSGLAHFLICRLHLEIGDWIDETLAVIETSDPWYDQTLAAATLSWYHRGRFDEVLAASSVVNRDDVDPIVYDSMLLVVGSVGRSRTGTRDGFSHALASAREGNDPFVETLALGLLGKADEASSVAYAAGIPTAIGWSEYYAGLAAEQDNADEAARRYAVAIVQARSTGARLLLARSLAHWAAVAGRASLATDQACREAASESREILRKTGATAAHEQLRRRLDQVLASDSRLEAGR